MLRNYYWALSTGGATGTPCVFGSRTNLTTSAGTMSATENITGAASAVVTIQVTKFTSTNPTGSATVNGSSVYLNSTFTVTLSAGGAGSFNVTLSGDPSATGSVVYIVFTIQAVSVGQIGNPNTLTESKTF